MKKYLIVLLGSAALAATAWCQGPQAVMQMPAGPPSVMPATAAAEMPAAPPVMMAAPCDGGACSCQGGACGNGGHGCSLFHHESCKTCVAQPTTKKVDTIVYTDKCVDFCVPKCWCWGCSWKDCKGCDPVDCAACGHVRTRKAFIKKVQTTECPAVKCEPQEGGACCASGACCSGGASCAPACAPMTGCILPSGTLAK